ncbi:MAG: hypothetical protein AAFS11_02130 [Planctomycetota bacterium]
MAKLPESITKNVEIDETTGVWTWTGGKRVQAGGKRGRPIERIYEIAVGPIPEGGSVESSVEGSVNPEHLRVVGVEVTEAEEPTSASVKSKLTHAKAREIRERRAEGESTKDLARAFGVSTYSILDVVYGRRLPAAGGPMEAPSKARLVDPKHFSQIRALVEAGDTVAEVADQYGISRDLVIDIVRNAHWTVTR